MDYIKKLLESDVPVVFGKEMAVDFRQHYNDRAQFYALQNSVGHRHERKAFSVDYYSKIIKPFIEGKSIRYLDIGCGLGDVTKLFADEVSKYASIEAVDGIDLSDKMVLRSKENGVNAVVMDISKQIPAEKYDLISAIFHVMACVPEERLKQAFENINQSLKDDGIFCFDVNKQWKIGYKAGNVEYTAEDERLGHDCMFYKVYIKGELLILNGLPIVGYDKMFTRKKIEQLLEETNFRQISLERPSIPDAGRMEYFVVAQK
jgi:SAM-dependent methyltransferase